MALTTGGGSLPFPRIEGALRHVFASYTLPFYPQLPQREGLTDARLPLMLREALTPGMLEALQRRDGHGFVRAMEKESHSPQETVLALHGWQDFADRARGSKRLKTQCIGPVTFATVVSSLLPDVPASVLGPLARRWVLAFTDAYARAAAPLAETVYILWDDGAYARGADAETQADALRLARGLPANVRFGFHSCTPGELAPWTTAAPRAVLMLDLAVVGVLDDSAQRAAAAMHVRSGGSFVFGVIDTRASRIQPERGMELARAARELVEGASPGSPVILSGGCGTGLHQQAFELALAQSLQAAAALLSVES